MFNIGSFEVLLVFIVALLVLGPERLPGAIRTSGLWIGRFRRSFYKVKAEIERELNTDEIRRQLHNESVMEEINDAKSKVESAAKETEKSIGNIVNSANFDPGASKASIKKEAAENSAAERSAVEDLGKESQQASEQAEEVTKQNYSTGKNPRLDQSAEPEPDSEPESEQSKQTNDIS
jgi:sec-independent protein translocase protein TatB